VEYTSVENLRNFPDVLVEGEMVVVAEKIHGTNCRVGIVEGEQMAGSHAVRRRRPADDRFDSSTYWFPWMIPGVRELLEVLANEHRQVILFGEVYGSKIQSLHYGVKGELAFRAFDLMLDGKYLDADQFVPLCEQYGVPVVPILASIPFSVDRVRELSEGNTTLTVDATHIREGVVVRPTVERMDPKTGRVCLKYLNDAYLFGKETDFKDA
jgi:RNA ligase (TIGR02306 family)